MSMAEKVQIIHEVGDFGYPEELSEKDQKLLEEQENKEALNN